MTLPSNRRSGLLILQGHRLEDLAETVLGWLAAHPLPPLAPESVLVQSNGMAEWLKMACAARQGVCAVLQVELPARFLWRAYRQVLGQTAVPTWAALDKAPLVWRLMAAWPDLVDRPEFAPLASFLQGDEPTRAYQLAQRVADLFDQYQVYRADWLEAWADGDDRLARGAGRSAEPLTDDQRWQPALWRAMLAPLDEAQRDSVRANLAQRFVRTLQDAAPGTIAGLPQRVVLFGSNQVPQTMLDSLQALSRHVQVLMAVPSPCRYHWADLIDGRELLRSERRRLAPRAGLDLSRVALEDLQTQGHPLLVAWGRQSRDFLRLLDAHDDATQRASFGFSRVDLFDDEPGLNWLQQVQAAIRDLLPLSEHPQVAPDPTDRSIVFHSAHSAQREVEILHDQLLDLLAQPLANATPLQPRDIVVMVPDIAVFAPAIRSVFGQFARGHERHIPWGITDQSLRGRQPLLVALEWVLRAPQQRFAASELRDLLEVPAVARRFRLGEADLPQWLAWVEGAGIRWGLDQDHRASLGLAAAGEQNAWVFGLRRMLLGYAVGDASPGGTSTAVIEPYAEVAGLSAALAGSLADLLAVLQQWLADAREPRSPEAWATRLRQLLAQLIDARDEDDRALVAALDLALARWLQCCEAAGFEQPLPIEVVREAWLSMLDEPGLGQRFKAGGVTFCTLLPMRTIPFEVVCLLGMNQGDYPRRSPRNDFDLMALPGQARPGHRSRRDDDRQLMLDALLSARRVLYVSWSGRSQRDNQVQPPSVLVDQLRDYLRAGWSDDAVAVRSTQHPLQPFSRRYYEERHGDEPHGGPQSGDGAPASRRLFTYAAEWRVAHEPELSLATAPVMAPATAPATAPAPPLPSPLSSSGAAGTEPLRLTLAELTRFLRNPVKRFFHHRLRVSLGEGEDALDDDEPMQLDRLQRWQVLDELLRVCQPTGAPAAQALPRLDAELARLQRAGRLPIAGPGRLLAADLRRQIAPVLLPWWRAVAERPRLADKLALRAAASQVQLDDWLVGLRAAQEPGEDARDGASPGLWITVAVDPVAEIAPRKGVTWHPHRLIAVWLTLLAAAANGHRVQAWVITPGVLARLEGPAEDEARQTLEALLQAAQAGLQGDAPWPIAVKTGLAWLQAGEPGARKAYDGASGRHGSRGERIEPCLARLFPDFDTLSAQPGFEVAAALLYQPLIDWIERHGHAEKLEPPDLLEPPTSAGGGHD